MVAYIHLYIGICGHILQITKYVITPVYKAETSLYMKEAEDLSLNLGVLQANNQLINDYSQLVKTRLVTDEVVCAFINIKKDDFDERVGVEIIKDSRLFRISLKAVTRLWPGCG